MNFKINFNPTKKHLSQIEIWLIDEKNKNGNGLYNNWNIISEAFSRNELVVLIEKDIDIAVGFLVFEINEVIIEIVIMELNSKYRNKGLARRLVEDTFSKFKKKGIIVCELFCSTEQSESFWKRLGFINLPNSLCGNLIRMYKTLIPTLKISEPNEMYERIELWYMDTCSVKEKTPNCTWNISFKEKSQELVNPIIYPAHYDWCFSWKTEAETKYIGRVKKYNFEQLLFGRFMIIKSLTD